MLRRFRYKGMAQGFRPLVSVPARGGRLLPWIATLLVAGVAVAGPLLTGLNRPSIHKTARLTVKVITHFRPRKPVFRIKRQLPRPKRTKVFHASELREKHARPRHVVRHRIRRPRIHHKPPVHRKVFGLTKASVTKGASPVVARVGNTLMKAPEKTYKPPQKDAPAASPGKRQGVFDASEVERPPEFVYRAVPEYPEEAEEDEIQGVVTVWLLVDARGRPVKVERIKGPRKDLESAAKQAAMKSRFRPALYRSRPVMCRVRIPYEFRLE